MGRWTWMVQGELWDETFATPALAMMQMADRQGLVDDSDLDLDQLHAAGINLALVQVNITPLFVLTKAEIGKQANAEGRG